MNIALVGFGLAGRVFHAPLIEAVKELRLHTIISSQKEKILDLYPKVEVESDFEAALGEDIDTVVIATPNEFHFEQAKAALNAGKNVIVDKPMAQSSAEIEELIQLSEKNGKLLTVFHNRRYDGDLLTVKKIIKEKKIGAIRMFESNFNRFRPQVDKANWRETTHYAGGIFFDLGPHLIDQAFYLFGSPKRVFCDIKKQRSEAKNDDYFHIIFDYENITVHLNASALTKDVRERFVVQGELGSFSKFGMDVQEAQLKAEMTPLNEDYGVDNEKTYGKLRIEDNILKITTEKGCYQNFYKEVSSGQAPVLGKEALKVSILLEKCMESKKLEKWINL